MSRVTKYKDGICPRCGWGIEYEGSYDYNDDGATLRFICPTCGATGKVGYALVFDGYYQVEDKDGNPVNNRAVNPLPSGMGI